MKTNATNDVLIWIQAAIPPKPNGHINRPRAAEQLGISERTLRYKLQQYREEGLFSG